MKQALSALLLAAVTFAAPRAQCVQIVDAGDGATLYLKVSRREITRIALDQGRIAALRVRAGELSVDADDDAGQVFVSVPDGADKPVNAFLTTTAGHTFTLLLQPVDVPADSIILRQPAKMPREAAREPAGHHVRSQKDLLLALAGDAIPRGVEVREVDTPYLLWKDVGMTLRRVLVGDTLVGERYTVANQGKQALVLEEREFYRPGVNAIAIDRFALEPGESTALYIVRERKSDE